MSPRLTVEQRPICRRAAADDACACLPACLPVTPPRLSERREVDGGGARGDGRLFRGTIHFLSPSRLESRLLLRVALIVSDRAGVTAVAEAAYTF